MFERFTKRARRVVVLAQEEARQLSHNYIGTEHILLGLLKEENGGVGGRALRKHGITHEIARQDVIDRVGMGKAQPSGHIPFTPRAKKTLELALREALHLGHNYIGTEHILLGLIKEGDGVAAQIMAARADPAAIRSTILEIVPAGSPEDVDKTLASATGGVLRRLRDRLGGGRETAEQAKADTTPAADATLAEAARLAGGQLVGSHHLLLAAL